MSFSRHNIEKRRLIDLVRMNPILWDCRLPHYKRSDKKKAIKWNELGRIFSVSGERVQRTFTSLREIFRRELNHEKMLGKRFSSKWEYYDAMAFLKGVIRERKSRERLKKGLNSNRLDTATIQNTVDEYQYFAPNDPNNPNNVNQPPLPQQPFKPLQPQEQQEQTFREVTPQTIQVQTESSASSTQTAPQNLNETRTYNNLNGTHTNAMMTLITTQNNNMDVLSQQKSNLNQPQQHNDEQQSDELESSTNNDISAEVNLCSSSSSPSIYIKSEFDSDDEPNGDLLYADNVEQMSDMIYLTVNTSENVSSVTQLAMNSEANDRSGKLHDPNRVQCNQNRNIYVPETQRVQRNNSFYAQSQAQQQKPRQRKANSNKYINNVNIHNPSPLCQSRGFTSNMDLDEPDSEELQSNEGAGLTIDSCVSMALGQQPTSARQQLYTNFGVFLATRLNTLNETVADELMNRILMLVAEK